jgi:hypothetical protein
MFVKVFGTLGQQHRRNIALHYRNENRRGTHRALLRDDLQHRIGAEIAGWGKHRGIGQPGGTLKFSRSCALRKNSPDVISAGVAMPGGTASIKTVFVTQVLFRQTGSRACAASAIEKNSPPDMTPNISRPSTCRISPISTRS